jgi:hypothetical protein
MGRQRHHRFAAAGGKLLFDSADVTLPGKLLS